MKYSVYLFIICSLMSCKEVNVQDQSHNDSKELQISHEGEVVPNDSMFHHLVFLNIKSDIDTNKLIKELQGLASIKYVDDFEINLFKNMDDEKAMSNYGILMKMSFADEHAYERYQEDSLHKHMILSTRHFMAGPPASYDYTLVP